MYEVKFILQNETGLHARPASLLIREASKYHSDITIIRNGKQYNPKSMLSILSMGALKGDELILQVNGEDEQEAIVALKTLFESNFNPG
jgi:phosphocarrier protein HPr